MSPRGPYPTRDVQAKLLDEIHVEYEGQAFGAQAAGSEVVARGGRVQPGKWARIEDETLTIRYGHRAADLLDKLVPRDRYEQIQVASLIVACMCGHPRGERPGDPVETVWIDHIALASGIPLRTAFEISDVRTPQPYWLKSMEGDVQVVDAGGAAPPARP